MLGRGGNCSFRNLLAVASATGAVPALVSRAAALLTRPLRTRLTAWWRRLERGLAPPSCSSSVDCRRAEASRSRACCAAEGSPTGRGAYLLESMKS